MEIHERIHKICNFSLIFPHHCGKILSIRIKLWVIVSNIINWGGIIMSESMEDYTVELEASFRKIQEGDILTGTIIAVSETEVTLDLGYYAEGIIPAAEYSEDPTFSIKADVPVGEEIRAVVISTDDGHGNIVLSRKEAAQTLSWDILQKYIEEQTVLEVTISGIVNGGAIAYVEGIRGFIPASRLALNYVEDVNPWLNKTIQVQVIEADKSKKKLILSAREILREKEAKKKNLLISNVQAGLVTDGIVESLQPYGAFVQLSNGATGLVHVSQISHKRIKHPGVVLEEGQQVTVKVLEVKDGRISLSMKALEEVASEEIHEEVIDIPESEEIGTSLGSLFQNIKLD